MEISKDFLLNPILKAMKRNWEDWDRRELKGLLRRKLFDMNVPAMGQIIRVLICTLESRDLIQGQTFVNVSRLWSESDMVNVALA